MLYRVYVTAEDCRQQMVRRICVWGFPGSAFPIQSRGDSVRLPARRQPPQGDGAAGLYKSVPEQIVSVMSFARFWRAVSPCVPDCKAPSAACILRRSGASARQALTRVRMIRSRTCPPSNLPCAPLIQRLPRLLPPFSLSFSRTSALAGRPRPLFCGLFSPARASRTGVRTPLGTALSVPAGNCSRPGQC